MPSEQADYIYENPPLIEVIAEIHWSLQRLQTVNGFIDPYFEKFRSACREGMKEAGYGFEEFVVPPEIPLELVGHSATNRFRRERDTWPVLQIGPGVFTANIVPPYKGWKFFRTIIHQGISLLTKFYPHSDETLKPERLHLRYINGLTDSFGMIEPSKFIREDLRLNVPLSDSFKAIIDGDNPEIGHFGRLEIPIKQPVGALAGIKWDLGAANGKRAIILEIDVKSRGTGSTPQHGKDMIAWLDDAHTITHHLFETLAMPTLSKRMGTRTSV